MSFVENVESLLLQVPNFLLRFQRQQLHIEYDHDE